MVWCVIFTAALLQTRKVCGLIVVHLTPIDGILRNIAIKYGAIIIFFALMLKFATVDNS